MSVARLLLYALLASAGLSACAAEALEPELGPRRAGLCEPEDSEPDHSVSFKNDVLALFERMPDKGPGCSCHLPASRRASGLELTGLDLSSYAGLMGGGDNSRDMIVVPGDPCASIVLQKVSGAPPFGARMPSNGPPYLTPREQQLLADWIAEGAHDN
jgi:hypothetical protein